jgi:hypothetical protein
MTRKPKTIKAPPQRHANSDNWFEAPEASVHERLYPYLTWLETVNAPHFSKIVQNHRLYTNKEIVFGPRQSYRPVTSWVNSTTTDHSTLNAIQSCVDTVTSRIARYR